MPRSICLFWGVCLLSYRISSTLFSAREKQSPSLTSVIRVNTSRPVKDEWLSGRAGARGADSHVFSAPVHLAETWISELNNFILFPPLKKLLQWLALGNRSQSVCPRLSLNTRHRWCQRENLEYWMCWCWGQNLANSVKSWAETEDWCECSSSQKLMRKLKVHQFQVRAAQSIVFVGLKCQISWKLQWLKCHVNVLSKLWKKLLRQALFQWT